MFPAHAGMIRCIYFWDRDLSGVPRPRGDDPRFHLFGEFFWNVFPAHAGMIRRGRKLRPLLRSVPRPRGG